MDQENFVHPLADVHCKNIGAGTKVWQYSVVLSGAVIGKNCNICSHCFIENEVVIGDNVTIKNGVYIFDGITLQAGVFIGPNVTFTNDKYPRSKAYPENELPKTLIEQGASVGGGAVILPGLTIGRNAMIGAGAVVTKDIPAGALVYGPHAVKRPDTGSS